MDVYKIIKTTDGNNVGRTFKVPFVTPKIAFLTSDKRFWFDRIYMKGKLLYLECPNYKVVLKKMN